MKKILLVTGRIAADSVKDFVEKSGLAKKVEVHVCPIDVASFISPPILEKELSGKSLDEFSMVIAPGMVKGNLSDVSKKLGIEIVKGPENIRELPKVLKMIEKGGELSPELSAERFLGMKSSENAEEELRNMYKSSKDTRLKIGQKNALYLRSGNPPYITAEIVDAPLLSEGELLKKARHYVASGAHMLDIGMVGGEENSAKVAEIVKILKSKFGVPVSIDTANENEIMAAAKAGVDLIMSIDMSNWEIVRSLKVPAIVIPRDENLKVPKEVGQRLRLLEEIIALLKDCNFDKIIADPIMEPLNFGFMNSLRAFMEFRSKHHEMPMLMGIGNVTELFDADSVGVNALLSAMAFELDIDIIFTTEASSKTKVSVGEISEALKMMYLARKRKQAPKDLGIDLLKLKDKSAAPEITDSRLKDVKIEKVPGKFRLSMESAHFRIFVRDGKIRVFVYENGKPVSGFEGTDDETMYVEIVRKTKISSQHAAYLGKELARAEIALRLGKNYVQDRPLF